MYLNKIQTNVAKLSHLKKHIRIGLKHKKASVRIYILKFFTAVIMFKKGKNDVQNIIDNELINNLTKILTNDADQKVKDIAAMFTFALNKNNIFQEIIYE